MKSQNLHTLLHCYLSISNQGTDVLSMSSKKAYSSKISIVETKINKLKLMLKYIPEEQRAFYSDIINH